MAEKKTATKKAATKVEPKFPVADGDLSWDGRGPIACGEHNSAGMFSTIEASPRAAGFQADCEACVAQLNVVLEHAQRDTTRI